MRAPVRQALEVGLLERQFGRYMLLERLGTGGMAEVFKAKSFGVEGFEKTLVIKRILPELALRPEFVEMFVHEAKLSVRLSHANIVQVFDLGRVERAPEAPSYFIAMEYVAGLDLATVLARVRRAKARVPFGMAVFVASEVAKALDHAHRRRDEQARPLGIVHRDVSPQNILLSWEGEVKVTDFGIAKAQGLVADEAKTGELARTVHGKLAYMSPEQSMGAPLDGRSDLFSLGAVLYQMIAGTNPFAAPTEAETRRRVDRGEHPPLEIARPDVPSVLAAIVRRLLARSPDERFADAGRLHEQLLGYFYGSSDRFGANELAEFIAPLQESRLTPEIQAEVVLREEASPHDERTPIEVPQAVTIASRASERADHAPLGRAAEMGERREVSVLVIGGADRRTGIAFDVAAAREVLARYGATILEEDASQITARHGVRGPGRARDPARAEGARRGGGRARGQDPRRSARHAAHRRAPRRAHLERAGALAGDGRTGGALADRRAHRALCVHARHAGGGRRVGAGAWARDRLRASATCGGGEVRGPAGGAPEAR
jgi:eukaryotic-like serine/threonine-protein kinase